MSKSNSFETQLLSLLFTNVAAAGIGDAGGLQPSAAAGSLYFSLHTASPGEAGDQTTNEVAYTGYGRVAVARSGSGFTVAGNQVSPAATVSFGQRTDAGAAVEATYFGIGTAASGAGELLYFGPLCGANTALVGTALASNDTLSVPGSSYSVNDRVAIFPVAQASLPGGLTDGTVYFIKTASGIDYTLAATQGGSTIDITSNGAAIVQKLSTITIGQNTTPQLTTSTVIIED